MEKKKFQLGKKKQDEVVLGKKEKKKFMTPKKWNVVLGVLAVFFFLAAVGNSGNATNAEKWEKSYNEATKSNDEIKKQNEDLQAKLDKLQADYDSLSEQAKAQEDQKSQIDSLTQKQKELAVLLDENKDYEEMEQAYQQWSGTEKEPMGQNRFRMEFLGLLKDEIFDHGKVKEIELSGNRCRILLSDWNLEKTAEAMERIEISPLVDHVELTRQNEQTELEVLLAGGEDHEL